MLGFILLRHVRDARTNRYWIHCYRCIRKYHPDAPILLVDDNSRREHLTPIPLYNTTVVESEYPQRGELLPYVYYLRHHPFDTAVILHDSVFLNRRLDFRTDTYKLLWEFEHDWDQPEDETAMVRAFGDPALERFYRDKGQWKGCFGCMTVITHAFLCAVNRAHDLHKLLPLVRTRYNRCSLERVLGCLLQFHGKRETLFGNIHAYGKWGRHDASLPVIKVWTGR